MVHVTGGGRMNKMCMAPRVPFPDQALLRPASRSSPAPHAAPHGPAHRGCHLRCEGFGSLPHCFPRPSQKRGGGGVGIWRLFIHCFRLILIIASTYSTELWCDWKLGQLLKQSESCFLMTSGSSLGLLWGTLRRQVWLEYIHVPSRPVLSYLSFLSSW